MVELCCNLIKLLVRGGSTGVPPPAPPAIHDHEKRSPLLPQHQQPTRPQVLAASSSAVAVAGPAAAGVASASVGPVVTAAAEPAAPPPPKPTVVKATKNVKINQKPLSVMFTTSLGDASRPPSGFDVGRVPA
ncbi:unnamed protein product [Colias eurytheme]|nr:unnamed protein product [Colias eurytheme]